jgi:GDP-4-dehydro-6-deoxy-D-mannose reductase
MAEHGLRCVRLRPFNHIGPGQPSNFVLPAFARQIARIRAGLGPPVIKVGNLSVQRDFLDVRDVARAYVATLQRTLEPGTILNVASGRLHSIGELLQRLIDLSGVKIRIEQDPTLMRPNDLPVLLGDASAARDALGWTPVHDCFQTLEALLSYWMDAVQNSDSSAHPKCPPR